MATAYNPKLATSGLILYLDAGNQASYPGSGTSWNDLSGRGYVGTLVNSPTFAFYSNGTSLGSATNSSLIPNAAAPLRIGTGEGSSPFFNGLVSTVKMYNRALSSSEISSNFTALRGRYGV